MLKAHVEGKTQSRLLQALLVPQSTSAIEGNKRKVVGPVQWMPFCNFSCQVFLPHVKVWRLLCSSNFRRTRRSLFMQSIYKVALLLTGFEGCLLILVRSFMFWGLFSYLLSATFLPQSGQG